MKKMSNKMCLLFVPYNVIGSHSLALSAYGFTCLSDMIYAFLGIWAVLGPENLHRMGCVHILKTFASFDGLENMKTRVYNN